MKLIMLGDMSRDSPRECFLGQAGGYKLTVDGPEKKGANSGSTCLGNVSPTFAIYIVRSKLTATGNPVGVLNLDVQFAI
jgi:hypothetical protein